MTKPHTSRQNVILCNVTIETRLHKGLEDTKDVATAEIFDLHDKEMQIPLCFH